MPYKGVVEFDDFFNDLKNSRDRKSLFWYSFVQYKDNWFSDDYLKIDGNEIKIYDREFSEEEGYINCNNEASFFLSSEPFYNPDKNMIWYIVGAYYDASEKRIAFSATLDYNDCIALLGFLTYQLRDSTTTKYTNWFLKQIRAESQNGKVLGLLYAEMPDFVYEQLPFNADSFKEQLILIYQSKYKKGILGLLKAWLGKDPYSLYLLFNTESITLVLYDTLYEEYGDRQELSEYVAILAQSYHLYKSEFGINNTNNIDFPQNSGVTYFESSRYTPSNAKAGQIIKPEFLIKKYDLVNPKGWGSYMTRVTKDKKYTQEIISSALDTLSITFRTPLNEVKDAIDTELYYIPVEDNQAIFRADMPTILFHYLAESEFVNYINEGRLKFAINAALSIGNIGISKAIVAPTSKWIYRFAVGEVVFEAINKAINNPIVFTDLQSTASGNNFLTIWNSYIAQVGNAVFMLHGFVEILRALGKSKPVLRAFQRDAGGKKALDELLDTITGTADEALALGTNARALIKRMKLKLLTNRKTIDLVTEQGELVFRFRKIEDVSKYLEFLAMSRAQRRVLIKKATQGIRINNKAGIYNKNRNSTSRKYNVPLSSKGYIAPDFAKTPYLYSKNAIVKIRLTGNYDKDFEAAFRKMGITDKNMMKDILKNKKYAWHHLDDLDENLESTFQLISREAHQATYKHVGSVDQLKKATGITDIYKTKK